MGCTVTLTARATDPDGDHVVGQWWQYGEVDTYPGEIAVDEGEESEPPPRYPTRANPGDPTVAGVVDSEIEVTTSFIVPTDAVDGQTLHWIFEVSDQGSPNLSAYQRVVLTIDR